MNLDHDAVPFAERVRDIRQLEDDVVGLAWLERNGFLKALPEFPAERLAADELLITTHRNG